MLKKTFFISSGIFVFILILWLVYTFVLQETNRSTSEKQPETPETVTVDEMLPPESHEPENVEALFTRPVAGATLSSDESEILLVEKETGNVYSVDPDTGEKKLILDRNVPGVIAVVWEMKGNRMMVKTSGSNGPIYWYYDLNRQEVTRLKDGIQYLVWDSLAQKIVYVYRDESGNSTVNMADPDGKNWKEVASLLHPRMVLQVVPNSPNVSMWGKPENSKNSALESLNIASGMKQTVFSGKNGADYLWSPSGNRVLMSWAQDPNGPKTVLSVMNSYGGEYKDLNFPSMVSKCVWQDETTVICALPGTISGNAVMPDDYMREKIYTKDTLWKIDVQTGKSERAVELGDMNNSYDAVNLFLPSDNRSLFFIDRKSGMLYKVGIK